ncbi:cystathionine beta-lyase [Undibacterium sp. KW1]|uniref:trans-sulfuration enzyme family protein n=1 Tax=Undibacterium sp. KW1 TaxID=2058624 RepID=UPI001331D4E1|nr:PLP-dependent transferase [Undibacterium sp. KW1]BBB62636.1 cystathionine beta-lyase [Undibacterium sp. KW1]
MTDINTSLVKPASDIPDGFASLSQGVFHASTIVFPDVASFLRRQAQAHTGYSYGQNGTPTHYALANKLSELEGGGHTVLVPTGLAAAVLVNSMLLAAGDHVLLPDSIYGPTLETTKSLFAKWGVRHSIYPNDIGAGIADFFGHNTKLVWTESPASNSMEMQDIPAIVAAAHARQIKVVMDNTWATALGFRALDAGVDFSIQALTKYVGGHSDLLMGAVSTRDEAAYHALRDTAELLGYYVAPDECFLALRGLPTLALRLERQYASALRIAAFLQSHAAIAQLNYPPLPGDTYHHFWKRDFKLGNGLLSFSLKQDDLPAIEKFVAALQLFTLGNSWGGVHSLIAVAPQRAPKTGWLLRLHVGVEHVDDLLADLERALATLD